MADRKKLAEKIRALLNKTTDRGCTEAEAMTAAEMAKRLMDEYHLSLSDLEIEQEGVVRASTDKYKGGFDVPTRLCMAIAEFCDVMTWKAHGGVTYFGLASDVEFAQWLTSALESFCWSRADGFQIDQRMRGVASDWTDRRSFVQGCVSRINERLYAEARERKARAQASTGRSLIVVKDQIIRREFARTGIKLHRSSRAEGKARAGAFGAGRAAGNGASFGRPVNGGSSVRMIGR